MHGAAILDCKTVDVPDVLALTDRFQAGKQNFLASGYRAMTVAPMVRDGVAIGTISVIRMAPGPLSEKQLELLQTFADQAVIAIENVRLFNETKEALERQTATAEILKVISSSPADVQPVFEEILRAAARLCDSSLAAIFRFDGKLLHLAANHNWSAEALARVGSEYPMVPKPDRISGRIILSRQVVRIDDTLADPGYDQATAKAGGWRRMLGVPMLRDGAPIGEIVVAWREPGSTPERQVELLQTFAGQAALAIENVRLFNETKEALEQQKASAEVLQVISSSVADTAPVFDKILESCERLFVGQHVGINLVGEDGAVHLGPYRGPRRTDLERIFPLPLSHESASGAAILERRVMHYPDTERGAEVPEPVRRAAKTMGFKSAIFAPMLWEGRAIGAIWVNREFTGPFSEKEIALLKTFADQAVIAIQNARLFREIQEKSHQLEIADQHKSAFLANMSHELRTPLNAVIGFSEMLTARYFGDLTAKQAEYVGDIHASGKHLLSLINDILDLSKIEAGRMELELDEFDLPAALDNALTLVRERAQRGGVALRLEADPGLRAFRADERKLKQVMLNLLSNAVKFTPGGGSVTVVAKRVDGNAEIAVSDTGVGIVPEDQEAIFEAFRQVGTDVTRKREGTGLGLALARRFVELHGGTIGVASAPGKGSTFTVTLPLRHGE
jgi:signal transduction histidine kinase